MSNTDGEDYFSMFTYPPFMAIGIFKRFLNTLEALDLCSEYRKNATILETPIQLLRDSVRKVSE